MAAPQTLPEACGEVFLLALEIQRAEVAIPDGDLLRDRLRAALSDLRQKAEKLGFGKNDIEDTTYALVATIDELLHFSGWATKIGWAINPMQVELFNERNAGVAFFDRMEQVKARSQPVLEVYYLCLALGFRGRYRVQSDEELTRMLDHLAGTLGRQEGRLSPNALRAGPPPSPPRSFPWLAASAGLLALSLAVSVGLYLLLDASTQEAIEVLGVFGG